jgi:two-component system nitrate/nitrite response regulator NarL
MKEMDELTPRQGEIATAAVSTLSNKELAAKLGIAEGTLKIHLHEIYRRLAVEGRKGLIMKLQRRVA